MFHIFRSHREVLKTGKLTNRVLKFQSIGRAINSSWASLSNLFRFWQDVSYLNRNKLSRQDTSCSLKKCSKSNHLFLPVLLAIYINSITLFHWLGLISPSSNVFYQGKSNTDIYVYQLWGSNVHTYYCDKQVITCIYLWNWTEHNACSV